MSATLETIIAGLGPGIITVAAAPAGLDVAVNDVVIHDPVDGRPFDAGDLALAVGADVRRSSTIDLVKDARRGDAAGVVVKLRDDAVPDELVEAARAAGVALLTVGEDIAWGQLHALIRTAAVTGGAPLQAEGAQVPLGDLFSLANALAGILGGPVTIEDPRSQVLAYSTLGEEIDAPRRETILGRRVPERWTERLRRDGVFKRLWSGDEVVRVDYPDLEDLRPRMAIAVRAGDTALGSIWVAEGARPLGADTESALHEAARIAALHLLRHQANDDLERRRRGDLLQAVLEGRSSPDLLAERHGFPTDAWVSVLAFELEVTDPAELAMRVERAANEVTLYCEVFRRQSACVALGRVVYVLVPDRTEPLRDRLTAFADDVIDRGQERLRAGIGSSVHGLRDVLRSRREADLVLRVLADDPSGRRVASIDDVRSRAVLHRLRDIAAGDPTVRTSTLQILVDHDRERGTFYVQTLRAYLAALGDVPTASSSISVHPNTFRYRLRRLTELASLDLSDPVERLVVQFQLELHGGEAPDGSK